MEIGNHLTVFDLDTDRVAVLVEKGVKAAGSEAASDVEFVITSLNSSRIVGMAAFGKDGIADGAAKGTLIIDMSSIEPDATQKFAKMAEERGLTWLDIPLSGGAEGFDR